MVHMSKMIISVGESVECVPVLNDNFSMQFFHFFKILIFWVHRWVKEQKMVQNNKSYVCHVPYLSNHTSYDFTVKILIFQVVKGLKEQKMSENDKNLSVAPYISGTTYHMIFIYGTHVCVNG